MSAERTTRFYRNGFLISWGIGMPIVIYGVKWNFALAWPLESMFLGSQFNYWGSVFVAFGYICLVMLFMKSELAAGLKKRLAAIGQMALTNYIAQSVICTFIFYGFGLGLFGTFERIEQAAIVILVWIIQLLWSMPWLRKYKFGPLEWAWRSLTYMKKQPMKM